MSCSCRHARHARHALRRDRRAHCTAALCAAPRLAPNWRPGTDPGGRARSSGRGAPPVSTLGPFRTDLLRWVLYCAIGTRVRACTAVVTACLQLHVTNRRFTPSDTRQTDTDSHTQTLHDSKHVPTPHTSAHTKSTTRKNSRDIPTIPILQPRVRNDLLQWINDNGLFITN